MVHDKLPSQTKKGAACVRRAPRRALLTDRITSGLDPTFRALIRAPAAKAGLSRGSPSRVGRHSHADARAEDVDLYDHGVYGQSKHKATSVPLSYPPLCV